MSSSNHLSRIHPYPFTPAFEAVRSAAWSADSPKGEVERQRAHLLEILGLAQTYLQARLEGDDAAASLKTFRDEALAAARAVLTDGVRARRDFFTSYAANAKPRRVHPSFGAPTNSDGFTIAEEEEVATPSRRQGLLLEEAVRRLAELHAADKYAAPIYNLALDVVLASTRYYVLTSGWESVLRQRRVRAQHRPVIEPPQIAVAAESHVKGVSEAVERFADEIQACIEGARAVYERYVDCKVTDEGDRDFIIRPALS